MEISYNLNEDDYVYFNIFHIKNSKTAMKMLKFQRYITPVFFIIISFLFSRISHIPLIFSLLIFSIISILWIIYYPKHYEKFVVKQVKKMFNEGKNDGLLGEHFMILNEEGITETTSNGETKVPWSSIDQLKEDANYLFLYNSSHSAYIIPKRDITHLEKARKVIKENFYGF